MLAIGWGVVAVAFAVLNASVRPIEQITGPFGLYVWNSIAGVYCRCIFIDLTSSNHDCSTCIDLSVHAHKNAYIVIFTVASSHVHRYNEN